MIGFETFKSVGLSLEWCQIAQAGDNRYHADRTSAYFRTLDEMNA